MTIPLIYWVSFLLTILHSSGQNIGEGTFGKVKLGIHIDTQEKVSERATSVSLSDDSDPPFRLGGDQGAGEGQDNGACGLRARVKGDPHTQDPTTSQHHLTLWGRPAVTLVALSSEPYVLPPPSPADHRDVEVAVPYHGVRARWWALRLHREELKVTLPRMLLG